MHQHFLSANDLTRAEADLLLDRASALKTEWQQGQHSSQPLRGQTLALVFEKPSLRTRVAFEAGMAQLGGNGSYLSANDIDMGGRESVADVARNLSRWVQAVAARVFRHSTLEMLAQHATIPIINALSDREHPCQALADMLTLRERYGSLQGLRLTFLGDSNNVCNSLLLLGTTLGMHLTVGCPPDYRPHPDILEQAEHLAVQHNGSVRVVHTPHEAVADADAIYTDVWASMGQEHETARRRPIFQPYQLNRELFALARPGAVAMHCLPAHRGEEITADVIDGPQSAVFDQAENRLHVQKALILTLLRVEG